MATPRIKDRVVALHERGRTVPEISQEVNVAEEAVREVIVGRWDEDKRREMLSRKVAGRYGH